MQMPHSKKQVSPEWPACYPKLAFEPPPSALAVDAVSVALYCLHACYHRTGVALFNPAQVAVAHQCHRVAVNGDYTMQHHLCVVGSCQHHIATFQFVGPDHVHHIDASADKWQHAVANRAERHLAIFGKQRRHLVV